MEDIVWLDVNGNMRIDIRTKFAGRQYVLQAWVKISIGSKPEWVRIGEPTVMPTTCTRSERARIKRTCADLAAIKIGYPYTLRSKL